MLGMSMTVYQMSSYDRAKMDLGRPFNEISRRWVDETNYGMETQRHQNKSGTITNRIKLDSKSSKQGRFAILWEVYVQ